MSKPIFAISSPYDTYSGYGARSRDIIKSIINSGKYEVKLLSQRWGDTSWGFCNDHPEWGHLNDLRIAQLTDQPDIWMQITIPNEFRPIGKYNIGITAGIEATRCKGEWIEGLNRMDSTYTSSEFSKSTFLKMIYQKKSKQTDSVIGEIKLERPVKVLFEGADVDLYKPLKSNEVKTFDFKDIKEDFCYLFVGHWMVGEFGHDRKNVGLLVKTFYEAFKNKKKKPALILKASTGVGSYVSRDEILDKIKKIRSSVDSKLLPNIYLLTGEFNDKEMNELYNHPKVKAMVSLTKGEGYGRPLLEFSLTGKPIMASGWSGHVDFLNPEYVTLLPGKLEKVHKSAANQWLLEDAEWFAADPTATAQALRDMFKNYKSYLSKSKRQKYYAKKNFSWEKMDELFQKELNENIPDFPKKVSLNLPKLNTPTL